MKSILIISEANLFPTITGSKRRIVNLIDNIRATGTKVFYLYLRNGDTSNITQMKAYIGNAFFYMNTSNKVSRSAQLRDRVREKIKAAGLEKKIILKYRSDDLCPLGVEDTVNEIVKKHHIDIVMCEYIKISRSITRVPPQVKKIIDTHDVIADRHKLFLQSGQELPFFYTSYKEEQKAINRADVIIAIQKNEEIYFRKQARPGKKVITIGDSIQTTEPYVADGKTITFIGSSYALNVSAIQHFVTNVLPLVHKMDADISLQIVGRVCSTLPNCKRYIKLGVVDDLESIYKTSRLIINPVLEGTGLNIKTVEAMAHAKPLVVTPMGARGISLKCKGMAVAPTDKEFAQKIVAIINNDALAMEMSREAVKYIKNYNRKNLNNLHEVIEL